MVKPIMLDGKQLLVQQGYITAGPRPFELFIIGKDVMNALSDKIVAEVIADLTELGVCQLPYPKVDIRVPADGVVGVWDDDDPHGMRLRHPDWFDADGKLRHIGDHVHLTFLGVSLTSYDGLHVYNARSGKTLRVEPDHLRERGNIANALITVLATRNVVKDRKEDKLAKLGIGRNSGKHRYRYTTTIRLPAVMDDDEEHPSQGGHKAPHLRRGHIRNQHYGPRNQFIRKVWIKPVFVNADANFVSARAAYNI